jgi:hypothetical protein
MVDVAEHVYHDDPAQGHPDVRTRLAGASYFFVGNGAVQAAVQHAPGGEGTLLGLLIMNPDRLGKKRECLTMDPAAGLEATVLRLATDSGERAPGADTLAVSWDISAPVPSVLAAWDADGLKVQERFSCPSLALPRLSREVTVLNDGDRPRHAIIRTGSPGAMLERRCSLAPRESLRVWLLYDLGPIAGPVLGRFTDRDPLEDDAPALWSGLTTIRCDDPVLDHLFRASRRQLPAVISAGGRVDGSIWQYNREWVRDQAFMAQALTALGRWPLAATMLRRLVTEFVTPEGATLDSSEVRTRDDVELDQNGVLLYVLGEYVNWTGDLGLVAGLWDRITAIAEYPLRPEFRHAPSGMLSGSREFWERHAAHGIEPGMEMVYQLFVSIGLSSAAGLARRLGKSSEARRWQAAAGALRVAMLSHPVYALQDVRGFVKRRTLAGPVQETLLARPDSGLPAGVPLAASGPHLLNPDTCCVLPIVFGFVSPDSAVALATLEHVEQLWNQDWTGGGYGRYHVSSEPDSPGAWPFASVFVARAAVEAGDSGRAWRILRWMMTTAGSAAGSWFEFNGPRIAPPFPQVGVIPWTWAEIVLLLVNHVLGVRPGADGVHVRPRLLAGLRRVDARVPVRDGWLRLDLRADTNAPEGQAFFIPYRHGEMTLAAPVRPLL